MMKGAMMKRAILILALGLLACLSPQTKMVRIESRERVFEPTPTPGGDMRIQPINPKLELKSV
jgi:hypothetical protein